MGMVRLDGWAGERRAPTRRSAHRLLQCTQVAVHTGCCGAAALTFRSSWYSWEPGPVLVPSWPLRYMRRARPSAALQPACVEGRKQTCVRGNESMSVRALVHVPAGVWVCAGVSLCTCGLSACMCKPVLCVCMCVCSCTSTRTCLLARHLAGVICGVSEQATSELTCRLAASTYPSIDQKVLREAREVIPSHPIPSPAECMRDGALLHDT